MGVERFDNQMTDHGWYVFENFLSDKLVQRMIVDLESCYVRCRELQVRNGLDKTEGTCHHLIGQEQSFMDCLSEYEGLDEYFGSYFGGKYILNSFGGNILKRGGSYASEIHRDQRSFSGPEKDQNGIINGGVSLMLNTLVMLDDFTKTNGATWLMEGGHCHKYKPEKDIFKNGAFQITGKAGSIAVWNSNLWHKAGENKTDKPRRSVTPELSRPFFKQGYDYPRALGYHLGDSYGPYLRQVLGFNSRIPKNLEEWYRQPEERLYKGDQG